MVLDYKLNTFTQKGFVRLPARWLREIDLDIGDLVDVYYAGKKIIIQEADGQTDNNKMYINRDRQVMIPKEIRNLANIESGQTYIGFIDRDEKKIIVSLDEAPISIAR